MEMFSQSNSKKCRKTNYYIGMNPLIITCYISELINTTLINCLPRSDFKKDVMVYHEKDDSFYIGVQRSKSGEYIMFFFHNCFASLQDVSCDALAVDILLPEEQGKVNGAMWGAKVIGTGVGAVAMGTILVSKGLIFAVMAQTILMFIIILSPL